VGSFIQVRAYHVKLTQVFFKNMNICELVTGGFVKKIHKSVFMSRGVLILPALFFACNNLKSQ